MARTIGLVVGLALFSALALGQGKPDPLEACYQKPDGPERLACFNQEMQRRHTATASVVAPAATPPPAPVAGATPTPEQKRAEANVGLHGPALRKRLQEEGAPPEPVKPIVARIVRLLPRQYSEYAFELDNGQTWEQAEVMANLNVRVHDTVTIKPGLLGAFFLNTPRSQRVRVHRIN